MKSRTQQFAAGRKTPAITIFIVLLAFTMLSACANDDDGPTAPEGPGNIVEVAQSNDDFSTLVSAVTDAGLAATLQGNGPFTVFAPTNAAFQALPEGLLESLSNEQLTEILSYHVVAGSAVMAGDLQAEQSVEAAAGGALFVTATGGDVMVNDNASVVTADVEASNGVIHAVDRVVLPDSYLDVVGIVAKRYNLQTLEGAVGQAGLVSTLQGEGPFTVFAPDNASFEGLDLSGLSQQQLQDVLTYHVLDSKVLSGDLASSQTVTTVNGDELTIEVAGDNTVSLTDQQGNTYQVTQADLEGTNGVVHIIDGVLMPG
ncbi:Uncaracterized surface protein containing fasciclin (FAS1) repeats [Fodinibius roseus]|uniref:Uncaracterized surface protein containing fasciclin (FAS1) repeats n=1 Tax=Fodinibius roseus TaxID=1194090 RepID=A0A1M5IYY1_9BACT|nr:fasciclin domain-containing protein [Fodinibius roseus]SHG33537.1 Uncaracterized surface protein containing fasciclin (FAS1) repeats [Fodinibius roseus]